MGKTPTVVGVGQVGPQPDRLVEVSEGFRVPTKTGVGIASIAVGVGIVGLQTDRLVVVGNGFRIPT